LSSWVTRNRWLFLLVTVALIGGTFWSAGKDWKKGNRKGIIVFAGASLISLSFLMYAQFLK